MASVNLFSAQPRTEKSPEPAEMVADTTATTATTTTTTAGTAAVVDSADTAMHSATSMYAYELLSGLIDPHNGDNGTDPAQTVTGV